MFATRCASFVLFCFFHHVPQSLIAADYLNIGYGYIFGPTTWIWRTIIATATSIYWLCLIKATWRFIFIVLWTWNQKTSQTIFIYWLFSLFFLLIKHPVWSLFNLILSTFYSNPGQNFLNKSRFFPGIISHSKYFGTFETIDSEYVCSFASLLLIFFFSFLGCNYVFFLLFNV